MASMALPCIRVGWSKWIKIQGFLVLNFYTAKRLKKINITLDLFMHQDQVHWGLKSVWTLSKLRRPFMKESFDKMLLLFSEGSFP